MFGFLEQANGAILNLFFNQLLDLLEEAKGQKRKLTDLIGTDVAAFIDEMIDDKGWEKKQKVKLNRAVKK